MVVDTRRGRLTVLALTYLAAAGLAGLLLIWLLTPVGSIWDPGEPALVREARLLWQALTDARRRPFAVLGLLDLMALPLLLSARTQRLVDRGQDVGAGSIATAAMGRAAIVSGLFVAAIFACFHLVPFRIGIVARWSLVYYVCLVLAYNLAFIPAAVAAAAVAGRLGVLRPGGR